MIKYVIFLWLVIVSFKANGQTNGNELKAITNLIKKWNSCHSSHNFETLSTLYAGQVSLYSNNYSKTKVIENKKSFIVQYPDFSQTIDVNSIFLKQKNKSKYEANFNKTTIFNGKKFEVQAFLEFQKINNEWKITLESDTVTEDNKPTKCITVVMKILKSSPVYIKLTDGLTERIIRNGGTSFGYMIEASPNPNDDDAEKYSKNYEISLHESYPDHVPVIARFSFNTTNKNLYQYDAAEGEYTIPLTFDIKWLKKFQEICN